MKPSLLLLTTIFLGPGAIASGLERPNRPNIVVLFTDDHGYADLSCQGIVVDVRTPHIDALAAGGVRMSAGYVTAPQCVPSRAGLLTGKYQNRFGVEANRRPLEGFNAESTIAERLKKAGYATGMVGKWHLGPPGEIVEHGFDDVFYQGGSWTNFDLDGKDVEPGTKFSKLYHLDAKSAAARAFIRRHHDEPFFLYVAYRAPHVPLDATKKYLARFPGEMPERRRQALAMLSAVDDGVGGVMASLREFQIEERTLIFFIGDNGAPLKIHKLDAPGGGPGWDGSLNDPLNGEKGMLSEGGIRVPFVVYWKSRIPGGQVYDHPVVSLDVTATAVARAGLTHDPTLDGVDLLPYLRGETKGAPHAAIYWRWIAQSAVREGPWKYLRGGAREYLFDLGKDPAEKHDVLQQHPEVADRLRTKLSGWASRLNPPGLETTAMSQTWEQYFDYYLEGKPAPQPGRRTARRRGDRGATIQGWVARNSSAKLKDGGLQIRPLANARKRRPFIATAGLELPAAFKAVVRLRTFTSGKVGLAWREEGQKDFPSGQAVTIDCDASSEWKSYEIPISADGKVIHVRLLLPAAGADIERIDVRGDGDRLLRIWRFRPGASRAPGRG